MASSAIVLGLLGMSAGVVSANDPIYWTGNGTTDGQLDNVDCDASQGAAYLYWVFASSQGVTAATIHFGGTGSGDFAMNQDNGTWKLQNGPWFELDGLTAWVTYDGTATGNPHLTISHGCPGETEESSPPETEAPSEAPSFEQSEVPETEAPSEAPSEEVPSEAPSEEVPSEAPSFEQSQAGETDIPTEPNTATVGGHGGSGPSSNVWLLVVALGLLLGSVVVLTPAPSKTRR